MADKPKGKSNQRSRLAKIFLGRTRDRRGRFAQLTVPEVLIGVGVALLISWLLVGFHFQSIPDYQLGDIADRRIEAPQDFTIVDQEATLQKKEETRKNVPVVFDLDLWVNNRVEAELRIAFTDARQLIAEEKEKLGIPGSSRLSRRAQERLLPRLAEILPGFAQGRVLEICLGHSFSSELENQMVGLVQEAIKPPGVILSRDALLRHQERRMTLRRRYMVGESTNRAQEEQLNDWMAIRDLSQARDVLRQNEYELTAVSLEDKKEIITFLDNWIVPNVRYNEEETSAREQSAVQEVDPVLIQMKKGRILVRAGDEVKGREMALLEQLRRLKQPRRVVGKFIGIFLIVGFFLSAIWQYFLAYQKRHRKIRNHYLLVAIVLTLTLVVTKIFIFLGDLMAGRPWGVESLRDPLNFYFLAPLAVGAILVILLVDVHISILYSLIFGVFVGLLTGEIGMFIYSLTGSLAAIYLMGQYRERAAIIKGGFIIGVVNVLIVLALQLYASETSFQWILFAVRASSGLLSGVFAAMLASLFLPILESLFEITTDVKLLELSNLNNPILRRLAVEAPGTYHHSIIVGTLAEAAAEAIDANALLVRVGAYYHDIGKLKTPEYYIENQIYTSNKHENLSPSMSSLILSSHVKDGLAIAEEINLVPNVRDLIPQHHGTRLMTYFYQKAKGATAGKDREVNEDDFRYSGPKPQSKEAAILMLADQVEAASRTLQDPSPSQIRSMIRRLIQSTIRDRQFDECDITMKDLDKILRAFERVITGMHHHRIKYPGFDFGKQVEEKRAENQRIQ
ncbi:HDIG domain-containing protein [Acidobacteria bacterium AH-259-O06]|nr:HDIG domain-containing protein [Acidobacteria bacterium AH-259-O06]